VTLLLHRAISTRGLLTPEQPVRLVHDDLSARDPRRIRQRLPSFSSRTQVAATPVDSSDWGRLSGRLEQGVVVARGRRCNDAQPRAAPGPAALPEVKPEGLAASDSELRTRHDQLCTRGSVSFPPGAAKTERDGSGERARAANARASARQPSLPWGGAPGSTHGRALSSLCW
jgi:hypothetical protein